MNDEYKTLAEYFMDSDLFEEATKDQKITFGQNCQEYLNESISSPYTGCQEIINLLNKKNPNTR